jgi:oligoendopeptidase F
MVNFSNRDEERAQGGKVPERNSIPETYKWNLEDIYPSVEAWERSFAALSPRVDALAAFEGKTGTSAEALLAFLREEEEVSKELGRLYVYANMKSHEDLRVTRYQELADKADNLSMRHSAATSFFRPEVLSMPEGRLEEFFSLTQNEDLQLYKYYFSELLREK